MLSAVLASVLLAGSARAAAIAWTGGASGDWGVAANWTPALVPGPADQVTIASGTVISYSTEPALSAASLTLGQTGVTPVAVLQLSTGLAVGGAILLQNAAALQVSSFSMVTATDITLLAGTSVAYVAAPATLATAPFLRLIASGSFTAAGGSTVTVKGRGYAGGIGAAAGAGPGAGGAGSAGDGAGGGGHGREGGAGGAAANGGVAYDAFVPADGGSGGGGTPSADGGAGGGALYIAGATVTLNGLLDADGDDGVSLGFEGGGGGAGGAVVVEAVVLRGTGTVSARGGVGGTGATFGGGGGGGGLIRVREQAYTAISSSLTFRSEGGGLGFGGTLGANGVDASISLEPRHWTGLGGDSLASNALNWRGGVAPIAGSRVVFGASDTAKAAFLNFGVIPADAAILPQYSTTVVMINSLSLTGFFEMGGGTMTAAPGLTLRVDGPVTQTAGRLNLAGSTIALVSAGGARAVSFYDAYATRLTIGGGGAATATLSGYVTVSSPVFVDAGAQLAIATGTLSSTGQGPFSGTGGVTAASGSWITATGQLSPQFWTAINGSFGSLRVFNPLGLNLSTAAGTAFNITGGVTVDTGAVLGSTGAAITVAGNWIAAGAVSLPKSTVTFVTPAASTSTVFFGGSFDHMTVAGPGVVAFSTTVTVASSMTVSGGTLNLAGSTLTVRAIWSHSGGAVLGGTSRVVFQGTSPQAAALLPGSSFCAFVASNTAGVIVTTDLTATSHFEWHRGSLDFGGRALSVGGDMSYKGGTPLIYAGSTVTFSGVSTQTISFPSLDAVIVDNPNPVRLAADATWGNFTINPARFFDGGLRTLTITGDQWSSVGAFYTGVSPLHTVNWTPASSTIAVAAGSVVNARLALTAGKFAALAGGLIIGGNNSLDPKAGSTILNAAGGSTITFRDSSELSASAGGNWTYGGDAERSWLVFEGTGTTRGAFVSSNTLGGIKVALTDDNSVFSPANLNLLGSFVVATGTVRAAGVKTVSLAGDLLQLGGSIDFNTASTGTIRLTGGSTQTVTLLGNTTLFHLVAEGTGTVRAAGPLRVRGEFAVNAGVFRAGASTHSFQSSFTVGPGGYFDGETSTVTLDGASAGRTHQGVAFLGGGTFWGLSQGVSSVTFLTSATAQYLTDGVAGSTIAVSTGMTLRVGEFRMGAAAGTPLRLRSTVGGLPWFLRVISLSSVTLTGVSDSDASSGLLVDADDGRAVDQGGNVNWDFTPNLLVLLPGETFTPGVAPGKSGVPTPAEAGAPLTVTVRAITAKYDQVTATTATVTLTTNDPTAAAPAPRALVFGATTFTLTPRLAEPSPRTTTVTATASFASAFSNLSMSPAALSRLQELLPGETAAPGTVLGKTGSASARVRGVAFTASVRAVDDYFNLISTITHTVGLSISASSKTTPAPQALVAGAAAFSGIVVYTTGSFTLSATDLTFAGVASGTSAVFGVAPPSASSPSLSGFVPHGARVATLGGGPSGFASDGSALEQVQLDLRDLVAGLHYDWTVKSFSLAAPSFATATLGAALTTDTTWFRAAPDASFTDGRQIRLTMRASNPTGLMTQVTSTFTFDRGMLAYGARDGQGFTAVLPSTAAGCVEIVSTVTLTVGASGIAQGGAVAIRAPDGWTVATGVSGTYPPALGFWHVASTSLASPVVTVAPAASGATALGSGWLLVSVPAGAIQTYQPGQNIVLTYRGRPPFGPAGRGEQRFSVMTRGDASGVLLPVSTSPVMTLFAGTTSFLTFADQSPLSLTPMTPSATMQLLVCDLCGNPAPGASSGTVTLSLLALRGGAGITDATAVFFNAGGNPIISVGLSTGTLASASPSFSVRTSTDAPAEMVLRATATFEGVNFSSIAVEAIRPVRLRAALPVFTAVSIGTGPVPSGATSVTLSAADPAASAAWLSFTFAEPDMSWEALISTDAFGYGGAAFSATGAGDAARPLASVWDGLDRSRSPAAYAAPGRYKIRLRAGGGAALDRTLEVVVPQTAGFVGTLGARGAGARVRASGPGAGDGRWAVATSTGYFEIRGLKPGSTYALSAATSAVVLGRAIELSTAVAAGPAAFPLTNLGTLALPATAYLRVALLAPAPSPRESLGSYTGRRADGSAAFTASLRLSSGAASSDDAGTLFGRSASTWSALAVEPGVYDVDLEFPELGLSTRAYQVDIQAGVGTDLAVSLAKKANVFGYAVLPTTVTFGTFVTVQARLAGRTEPGAYGGAFVSSVPSVSGPSSGAYALYGLDPGTWTVTARAPGFAASSVTIVITGTADLTGVNLAPGLGARITGSVSIPGDTRGATQCFPAPGGAAAACPAGTYEVEVEALAAGRLDRAAVRLRLGSHVSFSSAAFALTGLDAGSWTVRASLPGFALVPPQGATATVASGGSAAASIAFSALNARLRLDVAVPPLAGGACRSTTSYRSLGLLLEPDGAAPLVFGDATALAPTITSARAQVSTVTGAFMLMHCSSATIFTPALPPGGARATVLFGPSGALARSRATLADGTTAVLSLDVAVATYSLTGTVSFAGSMGFSTRTAAGAPYTLAVSSIAGVLSAAPRASFCLLGSGDPRASSTLRVELLPYDASAPALRRSSGTAAGACAAPAASTAPFASAALVAALNPDGTFAFNGASPGIYRLRVPGELDDDAANGPEAAPAETIVVVGTAPVTASLRLARGRRVSGRIAAPPGLAAGRALRVSLTDASGTVVRSVELACGLSGVSYALDGVPDGLYQLRVEDRGDPAAWTAAAVEALVAGADLDGLDAVLIPAATIRARLALSRPLPDGTEEHILVSAENAFLLPRGFTARATAVPYAAGGAVSARTALDGSVLDAEGRVVIAGLPAGVYDVEFAGPADASPGAVALVPARVSGVTVAAGQAADLGVVPLFSGAAVSGLVTDAATGLPVGGALVSARATLRTGALEGRRDAASAQADAAGRYLLRGLSPSVRWYDLTAGGPGHATARVSSVDVSSGAAQDFALAPAVSTITGRVVSADGAPLYSALGGAAAEAPGAALFLQRANATPSDDPLADLALRTEPDGSFSIPSLATGSYRLTVTASGLASLTRVVTVSGQLADLGALTLGGGGAISGTLRLPDGSPVPDDEVRAVAAVTADLSEFIYGSLTRDASARVAVAYKIGGLRAGRSYRVLALTPGDEAASPAEAAAVVLTSTAEARVLNLVVRPPAPTVSARSRRSGTRTAVEFIFSRPLRARLPADDDASAVVSTLSASGVLSGAVLSSDRRRLTVNYDAGVNESSFTLRARAFTAALDYDSVDPSAAPELLLSATAAFFTGETVAHRQVVANAAGGVLVSEGDAGRLVLPRGAFAVGASSAVTVILRRASTAAGVSAASLPSSLRAAAAALPASLPAQSDFYEIELPAGVPSTLARPAQLSVVYSSAANPAALNLYWYNPGSGEYVLQPDALGGAPALDATARTLTMNLGHFSTFVLLAADAAAIGGAAHAGSLDAYNFPNPFDLQIKSVTTIHGAGVQQVRGTMIRVGVPPGLTGQGKLKVFDATGRLIRTIDMGSLAAGQSYYQGWDGRNDHGRDVASGLYIGSVEIGSKRKTFKMAVIK